MESEILAERFEVRGLIREGGMGRIYHGWDRERGTDVAIKEILESLREDIRVIHRFEIEANIQSSVAVKYPEHFPEVVALICDTRGQLEAIVMEYMSGGDLCDYVSKINHGSLHENRAVPIAIGILQALNALEIEGIFFRDVKPENVLLGENGKVKLCDFGVAKMPGFDRHDSENIGEVLGSRQIIPPEMWITGGERTRASDLYGFGATFYFMLVGEYPHEHIRRADTYIPPLPDFVSDELKSSVVKLLSYYPADRPQSALEVMRELATYMVKKHPGLRTKEPYYSALGRLTGLGEGSFPISLSQADTDSVSGRADREMPESSSTWLGRAWRSILRLCEKAQ